MKNLDYDVIIIGAGPGGIFSAYELATQNPNLRIGVFEAGNQAVHISQFTFAAGDSGN